MSREQKTVPAQRLRPAKKAQGTAAPQEAHAPFTSAKGSRPGREEQEPRAAIRTNTAPVRRKGHRPRVSNQTSSTDTYNTHESWGQCPGRDERPQGEGEPTSARRATTRQGGQDPAGRPPQQMEDELEDLYRRKGYNPDAGHKYSDRNTTRADSGVVGAFTTQPPADLVAIGVKGQGRGRGGAPPRAGGRWPSGKWMCDCLRLPQPGRSTVPHQVWKLLGIEGGRKMRLQTRPTN